MTSPHAPPRVSVVLPSYNHADYIGDAIESVLGQTFTDFELIVIDDGSTDASVDVIRRYQSDPRVTVYTQANAGSAATINRGIAQATGPYVAILNSDDLYHPDRLARLIAVAEDAGADFVVTDLRLIDGAGAPIADPEHWWVKRYNAVKAEYHAVNDALTALAFGNFTVSTSNFFMRRQFAHAVGPFRRFRNVQDWDYALRAAERAGDRFVYLHDTPLLSYRLHGNNTILQDNPRGALEEALVYEHAARLLWGRVGGHLARRLAVNHRYLRRRERIRWETKAIELVHTIGDLNGEIDRLRQENHTLAGDLEGLRNSRSFKIGWALTAPFRLARTVLRK